MRFSSSTEGSVSRQILRCKRNLASKLTLVGYDGRHGPEPLRRCLTNFVLCVVNAFPRKRICRLQQDEHGLGLIQRDQGRFCRQPVSPLIETHHDPQRLGSAEKQPAL